MNQRSRVELRGLSVSIGGFLLLLISIVGGAALWRRITFRYDNERGEATKTVHFGAVLDPEGHIMVLMTHNTDIAAAWEREAEDPSYFYAFSPDGYAIGINFIVYNLTH